MNHDERQNQTVDVVPVVDAWRGLVHLTGGLLFALRRPRLGHGLLLLVDHFHVVTMLRLAVRLFRKFEKFVRAVASAILLFGCRRINRSGLPCTWSEQIYDRRTLEIESKSQLCNRRISILAIGLLFTSREFASKLARRRRHLVRRAFRFGSFGNLTSCRLFTRKS